MNQNANGLNVKFLKTGTGKQSAGKLMKIQFYVKDSTSFALFAGEE